MSKTKICRGCYQPFIGRRDAKTCSARCRKRVSRTRELLAQEIFLRDSARLGSKDLSYRVKTGVSSFLIVASSLLFFMALVGHGLALSQGYASSDSGLKRGMVVTLSLSTDKIHPAVQSAEYTDKDNIIGIAVDSTEGLVAEIPAGSQVFVEQSGYAKAYVSDLNGQVKKGDWLTLSPVRGVLMKAQDRSVTTAGLALEDFSVGSSEALSVKDSKGSVATAHVTLLNINIDIQPPSPVNIENSHNAIDKLGVGLTGHRVNALRVLATLAIFSTLLVIEGEIIYGTITSSITALGRNPLAKGLIGRQSLRSVSVGIAVLILGTASMAMLLWL